MKEWCVIVEVIAVLNETGGPSPGNVEMLRLIGVEAVIEKRDASKNEGGEAARCERDAFRACQARNRSTRCERVSAAA